MATIPNVYRERATPQPSMAVAQHESGIMGRALQKVGRDVANIGQMVTQEGNRIADAQADEAINKLRQKQLDLTVGQPEPGKDTQGGYILSRGANVVNPNPTGVSFLDQYRTRFNAEKETIGGSLSGRALDKYNAFAANADLDFQSGLMKHALRESDNFYQQTYSNTLKSEAQNAGANWDNMTAVAESARRVSEATQREAERRGDVDAEMAQQEALAGVHSSVIDGALSNGDAKFAEDYLKAFRETLPASTALTLNNKVQHAREQQIATDAASKVTRAMQHRVMPTEYDRAVGLATAPAYDPKQKGYFGQMLKGQGGNLERAWAAHAVGPDVVNKAVKKSEMNEKLRRNDPSIQAKTWKDFIPADARTYVEDNSKAYDVGAGVVAPTLAEVKEAARRQVLLDNPGATGGQIEAAQVKSEQWFNDLRSAHAQSADNALLDVQQRVDQGKITSYQDLTPRDLSLLGGKRTPAKAYIDGSKDDQDKMVQASPAAREQYDRLMSSPDVLKDFDAATIMSLTPELGQKWVNDLLRRKQDYLTNPEKFTAARVDADLFEAMVEPFLKGVSRPAAAARKHEIRQRVEAEIGQRRASGEPGTAIDKDKPNIITKYAMKYPVEKPGVLWGTNVEQVPGTKLPNVDQVPLAPEEVARIRAKGLKLGITNMTDSDILRVYRMTKAAEAAK